MVGGPNSRRQGPDAWWRELWKNTLKRSVDGHGQAWLKQPKCMQFTTNTSRTKGVLCRLTLRNDISKSNIHIYLNSWPADAYIYSASICPQEHWYRSWALANLPSECLNKLPKFPTSFPPVPHLFRSQYSVDHVHNLQGSAGVALVASALVPCPRSTWCNGLCMINPTLQVVTSLTFNDLLPVLLGPALFSSRSGWVQVSISTIVTWCLHYSDDFT